MTAAEPLVLNATGETVLSGNEKLGGIFSLDGKGDLAIDNGMLKNVIIRLVKGLNTQHEQALQVAIGNDELHGTLHALKARFEGIDGRIEACEDKDREVRVQIDEMREGILRYSQIMGADTGKSAGSASAVDGVSQEDLTAQARRMDELEHRLEHSERGLRAEIHGVQEIAAVNEGRLQKHQDTLDLDFIPLFKSIDASLSALKSDLVKQQNLLKEGMAQKADATDVETALSEARTQLESVSAEMKAEAEYLKGASENLLKLDECIVQAGDNKDKIQEMWKIFRDESQGFREWAARNFSEVRSLLRAKMEQSTALGHIAEIKNEVRHNAICVNEATTRVEANVQQKAAAGDLVRLADTMHKFKEENQAPKQERQLLLGTKCLSCHRVVAEDDIVAQTMIDTAKERQQEKLYNEVQRALNKTQAGTDGQDVLQFVAVHVGSSSRIHSSQGGAFDGRQDTSSGRHHLVSSPKHKVRSVAPEAGKNPRCPPRDIPPMVRVSPRRPLSEQQHRTRPRALVANTNAPSTHKSMRAALGPSQTEEHDNAHLGYQQPTMQPSARGESFYNHQPQAQQHWDEDVHGSNGWQGSQYARPYSDGNVTDPSQLRPLTGVSPDGVDTSYDGFRSNSEMSGRMSR